MKTIGLLGGMSWESSVEYYRIINEYIKQQLGGLHSAQCVMYSVDFGPIEARMRIGDWDWIAETLSAAAKQVEAAGAELLLICTNTMHKLIDVIQANIQIPIHHIADATAEGVKALGLSKVGLLGTRFTMEDEFMRGRLSNRHGLEVLLPLDEERAEVDRIIFQELVVGKFTTPSRDFYRSVIEGLHGRGAQGIIRGCTEIPLLISQSDSPIPIFDTTRLHAEYACKKALEDPL